MPRYRFTSTVKTLHFSLLSFRGLFIEVVRWLWLCFGSPDRFVMAFRQNGVLLEDCPLWAQRLPTGTFLEKSYLKMRATRETKNVDPLLFFSGAPPPHPLNCGFLVGVMLFGRGSVGVCRNPDCRPCPVCVPSAPDTHFAVSGVPTGCALCVQPGQHPPEILVARQPVN